MNETQVPLNSADEGLKPTKIKQKKNKDKNPKSKKKIIIIILSIVLGLSLLGGALYYFVFRDTTPPLSDAEFLIKIGTWEESDASKVKWIFKENGQGTLTTNDMQNYYDFTWNLEEDVLKITTSWLYELNDEFSFSLNREENTFTVISKEDEKESIFIPTTADSDEKSENENSETSETTEPVTPEE